MFSVESRHSSWLNARAHQSRAIVDVQVAGFDRPLMARSGRLISDQVGIPNILPMADRAPGI